MRLPPQNNGIMCICVSAADLQTSKTFFDNVMEMDFVTEYELAPYGKIRSAVVHGASQALVELYEMVK